jgi:hypothetical protein
MPWPFDDKPLAYRASMLPIGNYEDGSIAFPVWPQGALDLLNSGQQFNNAAFDPSKSDSANLLAANPPNAAPAGLLATGEGQEQPDFMLELLRRHGFMR